MEDNKIRKITKEFVDKILDAINDDDKIQLSITVMHEDHGMFTTGYGCPGCMKAMILKQLLTRGDILHTKDDNEHEMIAIQSLKESTERMN